MAIAYPKGGSEVRIEDSPKITHNSESDVHQAEVSITVRIKRYRDTIW